jgi:hypothetical protein
MKFKKNLLLWNYWANLNQTLLRWFFWSKVRTAGHNFGREPSNDYFIKILFLLSKWFQKRRFLWEYHWANCNQTFVEWSLDGPLPKLCPVIPTINQDGRQAKNRKKGDEIWKKSSPLKRFLSEFPIGSYVKLSSAVGTILIEGPNRRTQFWKRTIQWLFHQIVLNSCFFIFANEIIFLTSIKSIISTVKTKIKLSNV